MRSSKGIANYFSISPKKEREEQTKSKGSNTKWVCFKVDMANSRGVANDFSSSQNSGKHKRTQRRISQNLTIEMIPLDLYSVRIRTTKTNFTESVTSSIPVANEYFQRFKERNQTKPFPVPLYGGNNSIVREAL